MHKVIVTVYKGEMLSLQEVLRVNMGFIELKATGIRWLLNMAAMRTLVTFDA